ncbi:MAG TPA: hypothetical protein VK363_07785, partial [Pyrinomonadaceae bacterium]|nr:hypothetical protein [Pyrinomonadaceae bacterium]
MSSTELEPSSKEIESHASAALAPLEEPTPQELAVLAPLERVAFRVTRRMNQGAWKRFWTFCQRTLGMSWIRLCTYN